MDGTLNDVYRQARRMRSASTSYASQVFPTMIFHLLENQLDVQVLNRIEAKPLVLLTSKHHSKIENYTLLYSDFKICQNIAENFTLNLFATDLEQDAIARLRPLVELAFAGRP